MMDVFFLTIGAAMVLAMHAGFAFLEAGTVRKKNQVNALVRVMSDFGFSTVAYFFVGFSVAYGINFFAPVSELNTLGGIGNGYEMVHFFFLLTFAAAILRTCLILIISRFLLPRPNKIVLSQRHEIQKRVNLSAAWRKTWIRFKKRIKTIVVFTVPIYTGIFFLTRMGMFNVMKTFMSKHLAFLSWLDPQSIGIVLFHVAAEFTAGVVAAGALLNSGSLGYREIVLALLAGNVLSSPMRAVRHQFPYYAGIFSPRLALELIFYSQFFRVGSIIIIGVVYYYY